MTISESTRGDIIDGIGIEGIIWYGRLEEGEVLSRSCPQCATII